LLVLGTFTLLIWTKQGLQIDNIELFNLKFSKVYIKWNKKLHIDIKEIEKTSTSDDPFSLPPIYRLLVLLEHTTDELHINHFIDQSVDLNISYQDRELLITSDNFDLKAKSQFNKASITIPKLELDIKPLDLKVSGEARIFEKHNRIEMLSHAIIDGKSEGDFFVEIKDDIMNISAHSHPVNSLEFLNRFIYIPDSVKPWIFTKLTASTYQLKKLTTSFPLSNPKLFLPNLYVKAKVKDSIYKFEDKLEPIESPEAIVEFSKGSLTIVPTHAIYDDQVIDDAKVALIDIEKAPQLQLFFHTTKHINPAFLNIIKHYVKELPIKQFSGNNDIDFNLSLDLLTSNVNVAVDADIHDANLSIDNHALEIYDAKVHLRNSKVIIDYAKIKSFQALKTSLSGSLDLNTLLGDFKLYVSNFYTPIVKLLNDITVHIKLKKDGIYARTSTAHWKLFNKLNFRAGKHTLYLDKQNRLHISKIHLQKFGFLDAYLEGAISLDNSEKNNTLKLSLQELKVALDENETLALNYPFSIEVNPDNAYAVDSNRSINFTLNNKPISLGGIHFDMNKYINFNIDDFRFYDELRGTMDVNYSLEEHAGVVDIDALSAKLDFINPPALKVDKQSLHFTINNKDKLLIHEDDYNITYSYQKKLHQIAFHDIQKLIPFSPILQKLTVEKGKFKIISRDLKHYNLFATINYFPIQGYLNTNINDTIFLAASYNKKDGFQSVINDAITVKLQKAIELSIEKTNLDLRPFLKSDDSKEENSKKALNLPAINISAEDGFLQLTDKDKILYSKLFSSLKGDTIKASLFHEKGKALLLLKNSDIELYGEGFNDDFIKSLINFQGLSGGKYNFFIKGNDKKLLGGIEIDNATAKGFALYNNILSFLNTIPAIVTFNSPGFNAKGFKVNHGEIHFEKEKNIINFKQIKLKGSSSNILGSGYVDLEKNSINLTLRIFLLKDIGTIISSVPIAGYLLLGDDGSLTTTIAINGDLNDPDINIELGKDIIMAPINIIKRTILSPVRLYDWLSGDNFQEDEPKF
jgi:hypothetical protein